MSETSEMLLRHILEAPYPDSSMVRLYLSFSSLSTTSSTDTFSMFSHFNVVLTKGPALILFSCTTRREHRICGQG